MTQEVQLSQVCNHLISVFWKNTQDQKNRYFDKRLNTAIVVTKSASRMFKGSRMLNVDYCYIIGAV